MDKDMDFDRLHEEIKDLSGKTNAILSGVERVTEVSLQNQRTLRGANGDEGLVAVVALMQKDIEALRKCQEGLSQCHTDMASIILGDKEHKGIRQEVAENTKFRSDVVWYIRAFFVALVADIIIRVWPKVAQFLAVASV